MSAAPNSYGSFQEDGTVADSSRWDPVSAPATGARADCAEPLSESEVRTESRPSAVPATSGADVSPQPCSAAAVGRAQASSAPVPCGGATCVCFTRGRAVAPGVGGDWPEPLAPSAAGRWGLWPPAPSHTSPYVSASRFGKGTAAGDGSVWSGPRPRGRLAVVRPGQHRKHLCVGHPPFQRLVGFGSVTRRRSKGEGWAWLRGASLRAPPTGRLSAWAPGALTGGSCPAGQCWPCPPLPEELGGAGDGRGQPPPLPPSARVLDLSFPGGRGCCH